MVQVVRLPPDGGVLVRYAFLEESSRMEFDTEYVQAASWTTGGTDTAAASTRAQVDDVCAGSRIRPEEAQEAAENDEVSPVT